MPHPNSNPDSADARAGAVYRLAVDLVYAHMGLDSALLAIPHFPCRASNPDWLAAADARRLALYLARTFGNLRGYELAAAAGMSAGAICIACREVKLAREHPGCDAVIGELEAAMRPALDRLRPEAEFLESLARAARTDWEDAA